MGTEKRSVDSTGSEGDDAKRPRLRAGVGGSADGGTFAELVASLDAQQALSSEGAVPSGLWFHRNGPNIERDRLPRGQKVNTTPLDLSKLGQDSLSQAVPLSRQIARHLMTASNPELLMKVCGVKAEWMEDQDEVRLRGSAEQVRAGSKLLARVATHCQWGVSDDKVRRLLNPVHADSVLIRLSPMGVRLKPVEKVLTSRSPSLSIGKDKTNGVVIPDATVSRQHCVLELDHGRGAVYLVDCSTNGTFLNGKRLPQKKHGKVLLSHGDELVLKNPGEDSEFGYMVNLVDNTSTER